MKPPEAPVPGPGETRLVQGIVAPNPGPLTLDGTRTWLLGTGRVVVIDPGPDIPRHVDRIISTVGGRTIEAILLTHAHADHAAGARRLARHADAPIFASSATLARTGLPGRVLRELDVIPISGVGGVAGSGGDASLQVVETPGHSADHLSYLLLPQRWLFTGDLVLGVGSSAVLHPDGRIGAYLASLRKLEALRPTRLLPGHGPPVEDAAERLTEYRLHRLEREKQIEAAVAAGAESVADIRERVYGPLPEGLRAAAEASVSAHLLHMRERGLEAPEPGRGMFEASDVAGQNGADGAGA